MVVLLGSAVGGTLYLCLLASVDCSHREFAYGHLQADVRSANSLLVD
jgi:hypothetical protein